MEGPFWWYKKSQLILYDNRIYDMGRMGHMNNILLNAVLTQDPMPVASLRFTPKDSSVYPEKFELDIFYQIGREVSPYRMAMCCQSRLMYYDNGFDHYNIQDQLTGPVAKIQRVLGRQARARLQNKRLALAMTTHARLGASSLLKVLGSDVLCLIFRFH
jgi:hypothetical protein